MKKIFLGLLLIMFMMIGCNKNEATKEIQIQLSDERVTVDDNDINEDSTQAVYKANDIIYYAAGKDFTYGEGTKKDEHSQSEADQHTVIHITKPGTYILSGELSLGQVAVDLGEEAIHDPNAVVTLVLNNVDITCEVAPAIIFYNVYECGNTNEDTATKDIDTSKAGANVIIADDTINNINGSYVAKIYKSYELNEEGNEVVDSKKLHKYDGAFYSKQTLNINGGTKDNGILNITAENEGLDSELHLTINGGIINIKSGNDGINTNEDNISVTTVNGGNVNIICDGSTGEGDGIDSNGWLVINGGSVFAQACATSGDAGIDSDKGIYINGGKIVATGNMLDRISGGNQTYAVFTFTNRQAANSTYTLKNKEDKAIGEYTINNSFTYLIISKDELVEGDYTLWQDNKQLVGSTMKGMKPSFKEENMQKPDGDKPQMPDMNIPNGERPDKPNGDKVPPNGFDSMLDGSDFHDVETSEIFRIVKGANQFSNVSYR